MSLPWQAIVAATCLLATAPFVTAGEGVHWSFAEETEGEDVHWTSSTAVCNQAPRFDLFFELTQLEVTVRFLGIPFTFDVIEQIPPELRTGGGVADGPLPIVIFDDHLVLPPPPDPTAFEGTLAMWIDADGFGRLSLTDVVLGEIEIEIPPFGVQRVPLIRVGLAGNVDVTPLGPAEDLNGDNIVDFGDLLVLLEAWGACQECPADLNGDGFVDFGDLLELLAAWGETYKECG